MIFLGLWLSLGHFGQQAPKSLVSQLQNGVPPFIVDLLTFKDYQRSNLFFSMGILEGKPSDQGLQWAETTVNWKDTAVQKTGSSSFKPKLI